MGAAETGNIQVVVLLILAFIRQSLNAGLNLIRINAVTWRSKNTKMFRRFQRLEEKV